MSSALLKKLGLVTAILLAAWILYLYGQVPHEASPFEKASAKAERIVLEQGFKKVELRKESGHWKVGSGPLYPADENSVTSLVTGLKGLQIDDEISNRADRAAEYEVNPESATAVRLLDGRGARLAEGVFGKQAPDFSHIYFRYPDRPNVYLARGLIRGELGQPLVNYWRRRQLIDIPETKIQKIAISGQGFRTELVRASTDAWTLNGQPVNPAPVNALVGTLAHLRAEDFIDPAAAPARTVESLTYAQVKVMGSDVAISLRIGAPDPLSKRYPVSAGKDQGLAWVSEFSVKAILKKPTDFKR